MPPDPAQKYFPAIDGLRLLCAMAVVLQHSFGDGIIASDVAHPLHDFVLNIGKTAVDVFFSISGFLITYLLLEEKEVVGRIDLPAFYVRRSLRIWPVYYAALLLAFGGVAVFDSRYGEAFGYRPAAPLFRESLASHMAFLGNWTSRDLPTTVGILWSVCVEEQFYVVFPAALALLSVRRPALWAASFGLAAAWLIRARLAVSGGEIFFNTVAHADNLLLGALLAQTAHSGGTRVPSLVRALGGGGEIVAAAGVIALNDWNPPSAGFGLWARYAISGVVTTFLVAMIAFGDGPLARLLAARALRKGGQLTYAIYSFHLYALLAAWVVVRKLGLGPWASGTARFALAAPLALGIAWVVRITFEKRLLDLKTRFRPSRVGEPQARLTRP